MVNDVVSALAILAFDHCITIDTEIDWGWDSPWSFVRVLFVQLTRYLPIMVVPIYLYDALGFISEANCPPLYNLILGLTASVIVAAECLLLIRTWVIWGRKRTMLMGLSALGIACIVGGIVNLVALQSVKYEHSPQSSSGCFQPFGSPAYEWNFLCVAVFELVAVVQIFHRDRRYESRIFLILLNDIFYVLCILSMVSTFNRSSSWSCLISDMS
ncbi:hypothetical protein BJ138DRAFT_653651 [Hygrophoropsis aurantiaca]|uniref:Uncharacterized protein n=1 Tax=Hygrophoropsis aurantiaca TaxID=72124 RepID=A0ACB7ZYC2_9AGAM|nr:hypothetical protein BJ138DRAFT_653651 [Hygrophoropsis aurantiaca]